MCKSLVSVVNRIIYIWFWMIIISSSFTTEAQFVKGADVGWLSQMEADGYKFYDTTGAEKTCLQILKDHGINTIRLRVWVDPSSDKINGHCSKDEVVAMAVKAKNMGLRIMVDLHFSDSWADPGKQTKPAAWEGHSFSQLLNDVYDHTSDVLTALQSFGVTPSWVQIGNEISGGFLWPEGSASDWDQLAQLINKGYDAAKAVDSAIKVVVHVDQGNNNERCRWFFDNALNYHVRYDIIGLSYYPYWLGSVYSTTINDLGANLADMVSRYGTEVMIAEVGGEYDKVQNTHDMLVAVINKVKAVPDNKGLGVIYWEPEGEKSWSGYQLSCWNSDGKPTTALRAFLSPPEGIPASEIHSRLKFHPNPISGGMLNIELSELPVTSIISVFDINGKLVREQEVKEKRRSSIDVNLLPGIYMIHVVSGERRSTGKLLVN